MVNQNWLKHAIYNHIIFVIIDYVIVSAFHRQQITSCLMMNVGGTGQTGQHGEMMLRKIRKF